jgi:hypothetical protein
MRLMLWSECDHCGSLEERIFTDSWTGKALCLSCLYEICGQICMSPQTEGDNLEMLLESF